jgi:hypothetical protein
MIGMANRRIHFANPVRQVGVFGLTGSMGSMVGALIRSSSHRTSGFADAAPVLTARVGHLGEAPPCDVRSGYVILDSDTRGRGRLSGCTTRRATRGFEPQTHQLRHRQLRRSTVPTAAAVDTRTGCHKVRGPTFNVIGHRQQTLNQNFPAAGGRHVGLASIGNGCYRRRHRFAAAQH